MTDSSACAPSGSDDALMSLANSALEDAQNEANQLSAQVEDAVEVKVDEDEITHDELAHRPSIQALFLLPSHVVQDWKPKLYGEAWRYNLSDPLSSWRAGICRWVKGKMNNSKSLHELAESFAPGGALSIMCTNPQTVHQQLGRPIITQWSEILQHQEHHGTVSLVVQMLVKGKHWSALARALKHLLPFRAAQLDAEVESPLHYLLRKDTGLRNNTFQLLLDDAMAFYAEKEHNTSEFSKQQELRCLESILSQTNQSGSSLLMLLQLRKNRDVLDYLLDEYPQVEPLIRSPTNSQPESSMSTTPNSNFTAVVQPNSYNQSCLPEIACVSSPLDSSLSSSSTPSTTIPRSRLNFITFDRIEHRDLTRDWQKPIPAIEPVLSEPMTNHAKDLGVHTIEGLLSPTECLSLIMQTDFQDSLDGEYLRSDRDATRLLVQSPEFATLLWERLQPSLASVLRKHPTRLIPMGFGTFGEWLPSHINVCLRFSAYQPGSKGFAPHRDAGFVQSTCERSIFTLLIYLNGEEAEPASSSTTNSESAADPQDEGRTAFYASTQFKKGCLVSEEKPQRLFSIRPVVGRAILFSHDMLHGGDALSTNMKHMKHVLRTDVVFRRHGITPITPVEDDWRNSVDFTRAVELFQMAFKHELAGEVALASECYERCTNLRVAQLRRLQGELVKKPFQNTKTDDDLQTTKKHAQQKSETKAGSCPAMRLVSDCMRVLSTFLTPDDSLSAAGTCHTWWRIRTRPNKKPTMAGFISQLKPSIPLTSEVILKKKLRLLPPNNFFEKVLPTWHSIGGVTCIMSLPLKFYEGNRDACLRVLAVYAATMFSHRLPSPLQLDPDFISHRTNRRHGLFMSTPPKSKRKSLSEDERERWKKYLDDLRSTRIVLSYSPAQGCNHSEVEWCSFQDLITSTFKAQDVKVQRGTLEDFNEVAPLSSSLQSLKINESVPAVSNSDDLVPTSQDGQLSRSYLIGEQKIANSAVHNRYSVSFLGLLPVAFYHAAMCCSKMFAGPDARHEFRCDRFDEIRKAKAQNQKEARRLLRWKDAVELQSFDQATAQSRFEAAIRTNCNEASSSCEKKLSNSLDMVTVTVQEMRSDDGRAYFRVSFIGIPCL